MTRVGGRALHWPCRWKYAQTVVQKNLSAYPSVFSGCRKCILKKTCFSVTRRLRFRPAAAGLGGWKGACRADRTSTLENHSSGAPAWGGQGEGCLGAIRPLALSSTEQHWTRLGFRIGAHPGAIPMPNSPAWAPAAAIARQPAAMRKASSSQPGLAHPLRGLRVVLL